MTKQKEHRSDALHLSVLTFCSRLFGFFRIFAIAATFGNSGDADVINALFSFPSALRRLLSEGSLYAALLPELIDTSSENEFLQRLRNSTTLHLLVVSAVCLFLVLASRQLVYLLFHFPTESQMGLALSIFRWFSIYLFLLVLPAICLAVLHVKNRFIPGALAPITFSITVIIALFTFANRLGTAAFVGGVIAGGFVQFLVHYIPFRRLGYRLMPTFRIDWHYSIRLLKKWGLPSIVIFASIIVYQATIAIASSLSAGSVSSIVYSLTFYQLPIGIFTNSIVTIFFLKITTAYYAKEASGVRFIMTWGIRQMWSLLIPSAVFISLFSLELVKLALGHGALSSDAVNTIAALLQMYVLSLFPYSVYLLLLRYFTGKKDYRVLVLISIVFVIVDITLSFLLTRTSLGVRGLPIAYLVSNVLCAIILLGIFLREYRYKKAEIRSFIVGILQSTLGIVLAAPIAFAAHRFLHYYAGAPGLLLQIVFFAIAAGLYCGLVLLTYRLFRIHLLKFPVDIPKQ